MDNLLEINSLTKYYGKNLVLKDFNLEIDRGKLYLFVGQNGAGKSTLLKIISNSIKLKNMDSGTLKMNHILVAYLPEKYDYPPFLQTYGYLDLLMKYHNQKINYLEYTNGFNLENKMIKNYSKGMKQKLGLISTLAFDFDLYLLDEPDDGLDASSIKFFISIIKKLLSKDKSLIIVTHEPKIYRFLKPMVVEFSCEKKE